MLIISNEVWCNLSTPSSEAMVGDPFIAPKWRRGTKGVGYILSFTPSSKAVVGDAVALPPLGGEMRGWVF